MWVNRNGLLSSLWVVVLTAALGSMHLTARDIEVEEEDDIVVTPTPRPKAPITAPKAGETASPKGSSSGTARPKVVSPVPKTDPALKPSDSSASGRGPRVKMGDSIGFHFFVKSGYLVHEVGEAAFIGKVHNLGDEINFSTPKKCKLDLKDEAASLQVGDRLVVFRVASQVQEKRSGFNGYWVQNLAILKVVESGEEGIVAEPVKTYAPFHQGDLVKPYNEEMDRWNQSSAKKALPSQPVTCFVAGGEPGVVHLVQPAFIILTAGSEQGVVEGMTLEIREASASWEEAGKSSPAGSAKVFYVGSDHCLAQILHSPMPVLKGFKAVYSP